MWKFLQKVQRSSSDRATFARFATVGVTISLIDAAGLYILMALGLDPYLGRLLSYTASMAAGYILNRYFTFHHVDINRELWHSMLRHFSVHSLGGLLNFGIYSLLLIVAKRMGQIGEFPVLLPLFAVWVGGIAGLIFNFFFSKKLVFDN